MNAAFLLVTTAWFAGDTTVYSTAPAASACCGTTCASSACDCSGPKLLDKLRALCKKNSCDTCAAPAPKCAAPCPAPAPKCTTCAAPACDTCKSGPKLLDKLKACFHKDKCDTCSTGACSTCGTACSTCGTAAPMAAPKAGEAIPTPPKKMPSNPVSTEIPGREVRTFTPSEAPVAPAIENNAGQAPAAFSPSFQSDNLRSPF